MNKQFEDVKKFHKAFNHPTSEFPTLIIPSRAELRASWLDEEVQEFRDAKTIEDQVDAMIDVIYFAYGTLVENGVEPSKIWDIVQNANMSKIFSDGKPHFSDTGKTIKPKKWVAPEPLLIEEIKRQASKCLMQ